MLYIIPTPIGNLQDWTYRAVQTAKRCDYLLCEDTRHSQILLDHYEIKNHLVSFHKFNESERESQILADLAAGKEIGLISDGGTPLIQDPGARLVRRCHEHNLPVTALPGACSLTTALALTGLGEKPFQFLGFLPKKKGEKRHLLIQAIFYEGVTLFFETPHELLDTLAEVRELSPHLPLTLVRELTKTFEERLCLPVEEMIAHFEEKNPRGEMVLLIEGLGAPKVPTENLPDYVKSLQQDFGLSQKEAIEFAARFFGLRKRDVYKEVHDL